MNEPLGVELNADGTRIDILTDNSFREKDFIKQVPGTVYKDDHWSCPLSWPACHAFRGVFGDRLTIGPRLTAWAQDQLDSWITPALTMRQSADWPGDSAEFPHQRVGTAWLQTVRYGLIADEMRTGKTVQAVTALAQMDLDGPVLIVCPNGVRKVWLRHLATWAPKLRAEMIPKTAAARRKTLAKLDTNEIDVVICNWESLRLHSRLSGFGSIRLSENDLIEGELNRHWSVVIADEAHRAKDPTSKQTRALWAASEDADYRWAFTGTPIANSPDDLWAIWHFLNPAEMPGKTRYIERYCVQSWNPFGGREIIGLNPITETELRKTLDVRMLRRTQVEVWDQTPDTSYEVRYVDLSARERKAYDTMLTDLVAELESGGEVVAWNPLTKTTRLLQLACASLEKIPAGAKCSACEGTGADGEGVCSRCQGSGLVDRFDLCEPSSKLDEFAEMLPDLGWKLSATGMYVAAGTPLVVAARSRQLLELLEARLERHKIPFGSIHGHVSPERRDANIDAFQAGALDLMLIQTASGSEGIELSRASTMVFLQRPHSLIENAQTEARIDSYAKLGAKQTIIDLVTDNTWEFDVFDSLINKGERLEELFRDRDRLKERLKAGLKTPKKRKKETEA